MITLCCQYPKLIVSPTIFADALRSSYIAIDGKIRPIENRERYEILKNLSKPSTILGIPYIEGLSEDFINNHNSDDVEQSIARLDKFVEDSYLIDSNGEVFPVYTWVPCGHCDACNSRKLQSLVQRAQFAMEEAQRPAAFVTLTYNRYHIPNDYCVRKRHIDLFKKRFKKAVGSLYARISVPTIVNGDLVDYDLIRKSRKNVADESSSKVKFLVCSEYGKKGRPHYHMLIFGLPRFSSFDPEHDYFCRKLIQYCWRVPVRDELGHFESFDDYRLRYPRAVFEKGVSPCPDEIDPLSYGFSNYSEISTAKCAKYVTKYSFKHADDDNRPYFKSVSQNLGTEFVKKYGQKLHDGNGKFMYVSHFDLKCKEVNLSNYYLKKLYPTFSQMVPSDLRKSFFDCEYYGRLLISSSLDRNLKKSVQGALLCLRDACSPLCIFDFHLLKSPEKIISQSVVDNGYNNGTIIQVTSITQWLQCFFSSYSRVFQLLQKVNWSYVFDKVKERSQLLMKYKFRSRGEVMEVANNFAKDLIVQRSKQVLL